MKWYQKIRVRDLALIITVIIVLLFSTFSFFYDYRTQQQYELDCIDTKLNAAAQFAQHILPADYHDQITDAASVSQSEFTDIVSQYNDLCRKLELEYLWSLMLIDGKPVFTTATSPGKDVTANDHAAFFEEHSNPELYEKAFDTMEVQYQVNDDQWGRIRVVLIPHYDSHGRKYLFGASKKMDDITSAYQRTLSETAQKTAILLIMGLTAALVLSRWQAEPFIALASAAQNMKQGDLDTPVDVQGVREVQVVSNQLESMRQAIRSHVASLNDSIQQVEELTNIVSSSPVLVYKAKFGPTSIPVYLSDNYAVLGYDFEDLYSGRITWEDIVPEEDLAKIRSRLQQTLEEGKDSFSSEIRFKTASGKMLCYQSWNQILHDTEGNPEYFNGLLTDITELKDAENKADFHRQQLETANRELQAFEQIVNSSSIIIFRLRFEPGIWPVEFVSDNISLLGYSAESLMNGETTWYDINLSEDIPKVEEQVKEFIAAGQDQFRIESRLVRSDGQHRFAECWSRVIRDDSGNITHLHGLLGDITELEEIRHKEHEHNEQLQKTINELQAFESVVNASPFTAFKLDVKDNLNAVFISENISRLGYNADDFMSGRTTFSSIIPEESLIKLRTRFTQAVRNREETYSMETTIRGADGTIHPYHNSYRIIRDETGSPLFLQGLSADITEQKKAQERDLEYQARLKELAQELVQAEDKERQGLAYILHDDIGQMLAGLNMKLSVLHEQGMNGKTEDLFDQISELLTRIMTTTKSLTWEISPTTLYDTDIAAGLERMASDLKKFFDLDISVETAGVRIEVDRDTSALIFRCAKELLVNIAKHSGTHQAEIGISQYNDKVHMVVSDLGSGFDPSKLSAGKGYGLFSIKERLEHLNGSMHIDSEPGQGTKILMIVPMDISSIS